jgi:aspartokinase
MISQASSQHSVTFVVSGDQIDQTLAALEAEFEIDLSRGRVLSIASVRDLAIVAAVGGGMRGTPGVAGRVFTAMGNENINIVAIAQGSSELNITFVIAAEEVGRAVSVLHEVFTLEA